MYEKTKEYLIATAKEAGSQYDYLLRHLPLVEKWARKLLVFYPEASEDIVLMRVWLHDIGQILGNKEVDHAINSEAEAKRYLTEIGANNDIVEKVAHCTRSHRCKDVQPSSIEAQILAVADSASHMTDIVYIDMSNRGEFEDALGKLERDYRDVGILPKFQESLKPLYDSWKQLLEVYPKEI